MKAKPVDHDAFDVLTDEVCYWLGFLYADGSITNREINLALGIDDLEHIKKFKNFLHSEHKLQVYSKVCKLSFSSQRITERLAEFNIVHNKCHICEPPKELVDNPHFWRGVVDGDGTINIGHAVGLTGTYETCKKFSAFMGENREPISYRKSYYVWSTQKNTTKLLYNNGYVQLDRKATKAVIKQDRRFKNVT